MWKNILAGGAVVIAIILVIWKVTGKPTSPGTQSTPATKKVELTGTDWVRGPQDAIVTLIEYGDFQCPACGAYYPLVKQLEGDFSTQVKVAFREYPLTTVHQNAFNAALTAEAAGKQGKFWEMHDKLYENQTSWSDTTNVMGIFSGYAKDLGLDVNKFNSDVKSSDIEKKVNDSINQGTDIGIDATPTFYLDGDKMDLPGSYEQLKAIVGGEIAKHPTPDPTKTHIHADVLIYDAAGQKMDLSGDKYMEKDPNIHMHDNNGGILHKHKVGATLGQWLQSIGFDTSKVAEWYVNGKVMSTKIADYDFADLDKIVIGFTKLTAAQVGAVGNDACLYSEKCPERGKAPTEKCVGGVGTDCTE